jgi:hypothetical protein
MVVRASRTLRYWNLPLSNLVLTMVKGVEQAAVNDLAVTPIDRASRGARSLSDFPSCDLRKVREVK